MNNNNNWIVSNSKQNVHQYSNANNVDNARKEFKAKHGYDADTVQGMESYNVYSANGNVIRTTPFLFINDSLYVLNENGFVNYKIVEDQKRQYSYKVLKNKIKATDGVLGLRLLILKLNNPNTPYNMIFNDQVLSKIQ